MNLNNGVTDLTLPDSLEWVDEYEWSNVKRDSQPTIGGGLVISENTVVAGRPITLVGGEQVWVNKSVVDSLITWLNTLGKTYTLTLPDGRDFNVVFAAVDSPLDAKPVWRQNVQANDAKFTLTLRFTEI